jgi:BASS family bile acid:Na+ symporter
MPAFVAIVFNVAMLTFVAGSMLTLGLGLTVAQIIAPFKNVRMVILAIIANFLIVPLFAFAIVSILPLSAGVRTGILLVMLIGLSILLPLAATIDKKAV